MRLDVFAAIIRPEFAGIDRLWCGNGNKSGEAEKCRQNFFPGKEQTLKDRIHSASIIGGMNPGSSGFFFFPVEVLVLL